MSDARWELVGPIVRTQIHTDRMVENGGYAADKIVEVDEILLSPEGLIGILDGVAILHGHHQQHPNKTREHRPRPFLPNRLLSVGFTSHYAAMADYFGEVPLGCAAEDLIVSCPDRVTADDLRHGVQIRRGSATIAELAGAVPAQPCVPFTTFLLGPAAEPGGIAKGREFLRNGTRGFVAAIPSLKNGVRVALGDELWLRA